MESDAQPNEERMQAKDRENDDDRKIEVCDDGCKQMINPNRVCGKMCVSVWMPIETEYIRKQFVSLT